MDKNLSAIYTTNPLSVSANATIQHCIELMKSERISCLIVTESNRPVGIYTEADIVRTLSRELDYKTVLIEELMSAPLITAPSDISFYEASDTLSKNKIRHLVVIDPAGGLAGIITQSDIIAQYGQDFFMGVKSVNHVMSRQILTIDQSANVHEVVDQMAHFSAGCAIAVEDGHPIGILTERDMAALIVNDADINTLSMAEVMHSPVITIQSNITTFDAVSIMNRNKVRRLVVVDEQEQLMGVLVQEDIISDLESHYVEILKQKLWDREKKLNESQSAFKEKSTQMGHLLHSSLGMAIIAMDQQCNIVYLNDDACRLFHVDENQSTGKGLFEVVSFDNVHTGSIEGIKEEIASKGEYWFIHLSNHNSVMRHIESRITPILDSGQTTGYSLVAQDITDKLHTEKRLLLASHVFEAALEGIMVTDANGTIESVNPAFTEITGYSAEEAIGNNPSMLQSSRHPAEFYEAMWQTIKESGQWQGEIWNRRKNGDTFPERLTISSVKDLNGNVSQYTAVFFDITDLKEKEEKINHRAYHDPLTELPNRLLFKDRLAQAISRARRSGLKLVVMFLDIDHFKRLNDTQGHFAGDEFLREISMQFRATLRDQDTISRFAGDEFTVLMDDNNNTEDAIAVADKLLELFREPFEINGQEVQLGASIGIACYPKDGSNPDALMKNADTAMYHAKRNGRNNYQLFKDEMATQIKERITLEGELRKALGNNELEIVYQPIIDLHSKSIVSMEALLRWDKPGKENVTPTDFIPIAEQSGLIIPIGEWMIRHTCEQMSEWITDDISGLAISVNLSARQFREKHLLETITRILDETHLNPKQLSLEITEKSVMADMGGAIKTLDYLKEMGVRIIMDDFGTGYSSLTCLQKVPVDALKLDRSFIHNIDTNREAARLASGILAMAKDLGLETVAEGVENEAQLQFLEEHGCDRVQGYLFHKPLSQQEVHKVLTAQRDQ